MLLAFCFAETTEHSAHPHPYTRASPLHLWSDAFVVCRLYLTALAITLVTHWVPLQNWKKNTWPWEWKKFLSTQGDSNMQPSEYHCFTARLGQWFPNPALHHNHLRSLFWTAHEQQSLARKSQSSMTSIQIGGRTYNVKLKQFNCHKNPNPAGTIQESTLLVSGQVQVTDLSPIFRPALPLFWASWSCRGKNLTLFLSRHRCYLWVSPLPAGGQEQLLSRSVSTWAFLILTFESY